MFRLWIMRAGLAGVIASLALGLAIWSGEAMHVAWEAYLQAGTCAAPEATPRIRLGDPVHGVPVGVSGTPSGSPPIRFNPVGPDPLLPVLTSTESIPVALDDLLAVPHAAVVESVDMDSDSRTTLACGNVGGVATDGELLFGLQAQVADISGVAWLRANPDDTTTVTLFVTQGVAAGGYAALHTPTAGDTPVAATATMAPTEAATPTEVTVEARDIYFEPKEFTIPANTDVVVRLPNTGVILHNFSITAHKNPTVPNLGISIDLVAGAEEMVTINAPAGDYYFFCNVPGHEAAGMFGTMHVVAS